MYLSSNDIESSRSKSVLEWVVNQDGGMIKQMLTDVPSLLLQPNIDLYRTTYFNQSIMPFDAFDRYLSGFDKQSINKFSASLLVALNKSIRLTIYIASHINFDECSFGKKFVLEIPKHHGIMFHQHLLHSGAKGRYGMADHRLFSYAIHKEASPEGPAMMV
jgi:hypothetical protein